MTGRLTGSEPQAEGGHWHRDLHEESAWPSLAGEGTMEGERSVSRQGIASLLVSKLLPQAAILNLGATGGCSGALSYVELSLPLPPDSDSDVVTYWYPVTTCWVSLTVHPTPSLSLHPCALWCGTCSCCRWHSFVGLYWGRHHPACVPGGQQRLCDRARRRKHVHHQRGVLLVCGQWLNRGEGVSNLSFGCMQWVVVSVKEVPTSRFHDGVRLTSASSFTPKQAVECLMLGSRQHV